MNNWAQVSYSIWQIHCCLFSTLSNHVGEWSGGAKVLGKLSVPGRPTNLDNGRARAYCACSMCGRGLFGHIFSGLSFLCSFSLSWRQPDID